MSDRHDRGGRRVPLIRVHVIALAAVALQVAACAGGTGSAGARDTVTAQEICSTGTGGTSTVVAGVTQYRGMHLACTITSSDPRLDGTQDTTLAIDERADGSADLWGDLLITTKDGAWSGVFTGTVAVGYTTHTIDGTGKGSGAYDGDDLILHATSPDGTHFELTATIAAAP